MQYQETFWKNSADLSCNLDSSSIAEAFSCLSVRMISASIQDRMAENLEVFVDTETFQKGPV